MNNILPPIGMRNIKTAISVFITLILYQLVGNRDPLYAALAAINCVLPTVGSSLIAGRNRILGTILGGIGGYIVIILSQRYFETQIYNTTIAIAIVILIYLCKVIKIPDAASMSCIVLLMLTLISRGQKDSLLYVCNRVFDTSIGIVIAITVNQFVSSPRKWLDLRKNHGGGDSNSK